MSPGIVNWFMFYLFPSPPTGQSLNPRNGSIGKSSLGHSGIQSDEPLLDGLACFLWGFFLEIKLNSLFFNNSLILFMSFFKCDFYF